MSSLLVSLGEFITTPSFRWFFVFLGIIINIIKFYNEPHRFSYRVAFSGLTYKWHMYILGVIACISYCFMLLSLWITIPFTKNMPDNWYLYVFIICIAILTQITTNTKQISDDGSFNPPPPYMFGYRNRILIAYIALIINIIVMVQTYIYFGIADISKKTVFSRYFLERFGGWYNNNKLDFIYDWAGLIEIFISIYILYLQYTFQACDYGLPPSWNF